MSNPLEQSNDPRPPKAEPASSEGRQQRPRTDWWGTSPTDRPLPLQPPAWLVIVADEALLAEYSGIPRTRAAMEEDHFEDLAIRLDDWAMEHTGIPDDGANLLGPREGQRRPSSPGHLWQLMSDFWEVRRSEHPVAALIHFVESRLKYNEQLIERHCTAQTFPMPGPSEDDILSSIANDCWCLDLLKHHRSRLEALFSCGTAGAWAPMVIDDR